MVTSAFSRSFSRTEIQDGPDAREPTLTSAAVAEIDALDDVGYLEEPYRWMNHTGVDPTVVGNTQMMLFRIGMISRIFNGLGRLRLPVSVMTYPFPLVRKMRR